MIESKHNQYYLLAQVIKNTEKQGQYMHGNAIIIDTVLMQCELWHLNIKPFKAANLKLISH